MPEQNRAGEIEWKLDRLKRQRNIQDADYERLLRDSGVDYVMLEDAEAALPHGVPANSPPSTEHQSRFALRA